MSVYIKNTLVDGLEQHAIHALRLSTTAEQKRVIGNICEMVKYIKSQHEKQKKQITARVNKMRKINKFYGRSKPKEAKM